MALTLRKRHTAACRKKNALPEYQDYRRCGCPFWAIGSIRIDGFVRVSTKESRIDLAELTKRQWEEAGTTKILALKPEPPQLEKLPTTIEQAETEFETAYIAAKKLKESTARKYRTMLRQLRAFAANRGYRYLKEFGLAELQEFQASWAMAARTAAKRVEHLRTFWQFCVEREFAAVNPTTKLHMPTPPVTPKEPFSNEELDRIFVTARQYPTRRGDFVGPRAYALALLLRYTGLRISDALMFSPEKLDGSRAFLYMKKTGDPVYVWLPPFVVEAVKSVSLVDGKYFWTTRGTEDLENVRKSWTKQFSRIFAASGPFTSPPHLHRFRHTFAVSLLQKGVAVDDVAVLLGHADPRITLRHYARWVKGRQDRLDNILKEAWSTEQRAVRGSRDGRTRTRGTEILTAARS